VRDAARDRFEEACAHDRAGREREAFQALGRLVVDELELQGHDRAAAFSLDQLG
jgi:hypothetical protein